MDTRNKSIRIVMLPWLAHGHISPFLDLAKALSKRNFILYICSTPINLGSIRKKLSGKDSISVKLVELHLPSMADLPSHYHTTNGLPPHLMPRLKQAFDMAKPAFSNILFTLKPDLVIYDILQPWAPSVASSLRIPAVFFLTCGAAFSSYLCHRRWRSSSDFPFPAMYLRDYEMNKYASMAQSADGVRDSDKFFACMAQSSDIVLIKTWREIEAKYIGYFSELSEKKIVSVGPLVQIQATDDDQHKEIIEWLNKKERDSTVFASFGSEYFLTKEEIEGIALGLDRSGLDFIWVVRFPSGKDTKLEDVMPRGFLDRVGAERSMMVEGWAPQPRILRHKSIGGFFSHCGWSSLMEGIKYGKPIIAMPMQLDQPMNSRLVEEVGVGKEIVRDMDGKVHAEEVGRVIRVVVADKSGEDVRRKMKELSEKMVVKQEEEEIDVAVEEMVKLCRRVERHDSMDVLLEKSYVTCV